MDVFGLAVTAGGDFLAAAALAAAHELGVVDALAGGALTVDELAEVVGVGSGRRRLARLCDVLVLMGVLARDDDGRLVQVRAAPRPEVVPAGWGRLAEVVRDDRPLAEEDGAEALARYHGHLLAAGAAAADELAALVAGELGARSLLDVGGGAGAYTAAFVARAADARATLVDREEVLALARAALAARGVAERVTLVAGDGRTSGGDGFDAVLLANVLHLHGEAVCRELVAAAVRAVRAGGVVIVKDLRVDDDRRGSREGVWFALNMAVYTEGGDVWPTSTVVGWLADTGLVDIEVRRLASAPDAVVVLGRKPPGDHASPLALSAARATASAESKGQGSPWPDGALAAAPADAEARRRRADEDGFLYLPGLLPAERLAALREVVDAALATRGWLVDGRSDPALRLGRWDDARWVELLAEVLPTAAFRELAAAPELLAAVRDVLGGEPQLHVGDVLRVVSPGAAELATPPHQDAAYLDDGGRGVWTAWLPLVPCPRALGPLALAPGSHRGGLLPHAAVTPGAAAVGTALPADTRWRSADLGPGDVILFSSLTVHRALPNTTADRLRLSVDYRYRLRR